LSLTEGKNRQVRKMTAAVGFPTLRLIRYSIGKLSISGMQPGDIIEMGQKEMMYQLL
jgi:23S rRNA pseudouridine2457 synthase